MVDYTIKNKTTGKMVLPEGYNYLLNVIPPSFNEFLFGNRKYIDDSNAIPHVNRYTNSMKYRDLHLFEVLFTSSIYTNETAIPLFDLSQHFMHLHRVNSIRTGYHNRLCHTIESDGVVILSFKDDMGIYVKKPLPQKLIDRTLRIVLCDPIKYDLYNIDTVVEQVFKDCKALLTTGILSELHFIENRDKYAKQHKDTISNMKTAIINDDYDTFKTLALSLPLSDYRVEAMNKDNITFDMNGGSKVKNIPSASLNSQQFYEGLLRTNDDVLITPYNKNYHYTKEKGHKTQYVESFKVYFKELSDVEAFLEVYKHTGCFNNATFFMLLNELPSKSKKPVVYKFSSEHINIFNDKMKNSSLRLDIANRKTPFGKIDGKDIHGYLGLSSIIINKEYDDNDERIVKEFAESVESSFSSLGFNGGILYHPSFNVWNTRLLNTKVLHHINHNASVIDDTLSLSYGLYHIETIDQCFKFLDMKRKEPIPPYMRSMSRNENSAINMRIPIFMDDSDNVQSLLRIINRQKLTGKIGKVAIRRLELAPYATNSNEHTENIIDAISQL